MFQRMFGKMMAIAALGFGMAAAGCDMNISIGGEEGVPLAELDTSGPPPSGIVLAGPDTVIVTEGEALSIEVEGDEEAVELLRFTLDDDTLGIMREPDSWSQDGKAVVRVTMPLPEEVTVAGSGRIELPGLQSDAEVTIAGSGHVVASEIAVDELEVTIAGSGHFAAAGSARRLELTIAGSGDARMEGLQVETAEISVAGSGNARFASDGKVEAKIAGSGDVTVTGSATCTIKSMGSGSLTCKPAESAADDADEASKSDEADAADGEDTGS